MIVRLSCWWSTPNIGGHVRYWRVLMQMSVTEWWMRSSITRVAFSSFPTHGWGRGYSREHMIHHCRGTRGFERIIWLFGRDLSERASSGMWCSMLKSVKLIRGRMGNWPTPHDCYIHFTSLRVNGKVFLVVDRLVGEVLHLPTSLQIDQIYPLFLHPHHVHDCKGCKNVLLGDFQITWAPKKS